MTEIVNLRLARKRKARAEAEREAAERRAKFGRPKAEREAQGLREDVARRMLEGHRLNAADEP